LADKILVFFVQVSALILLLLIEQASFQCPSPLSYLLLTSGFPSSFSLGARSLCGTEVQAWHGAGLGLGSSLFLTAGGVIWGCAKGSMLLFLVAFLV